MLNQSHIRGLLASYDFSEGTGTTLTDKSGNGNNAAIVGGTWTTDRFGRANRAILLDGVNDYIDCGLANYQGDLGVVISCKIPSWQSSKYIINKGGSAAGSIPSFRIYNSATTNRVDMRINDAVPNNTTMTLTDAAFFNTWSAVGGSIKNATGGSIMVDGSQGTLLAATVSSNFATGYKILIGAIEGPTAFLNIVVDRVMLFNRFLSGHELSKLANRLKIGDLDK